MKSKRISVVPLKALSTVLKMYNVLIRFVVLSCLFQLILTYNLNTLQPIIYEDAQKMMRVNPKSLYGYTTALYRGKDKPRIYIGAPKGENNGVPAKNPGVVFNCEIKQPCEFLAIGDLDSQDDSWTGGTMDIHTNTHTMVICGFRYFTHLQSRMIGACYLSNLDEVSSCRKLLPLADPSRATKIITKSASISIYYYQFGEAGFSAHFTDDQQNPNLILGTPGLLNWYGGSVLYSNVKSPNRMQYRVAYQWYGAYSLFGYAVSSGRYAKGKHTLYASSSPKNKDYFGAVVLFQFGPHNDSSIEKRGILYGSQIGESFGAALASGDINRDGYDDLVIGAPCYTETNFNDGRIHIYYGGENFPLETSATHITGSNDGGQFGIAVTFLGDLNLDGYGDIAVGEPFSNNKKGNVFIYHGGPNGLIEIPAQILQAEAVDSHLRGFGISISKGVDIDGNRYPDISVGAHISGHAVIFRSNPIVEITSQLTIINGTKINVNGSTTLKLCYSTTPEYKSISILRKLVIDPNYNRVILAQPKDAVKELKNYCESFVLITAAEQLHDPEQPVKFSVNYELKEKDRKKSNFYVGVNNTNTDRFCKTCPILRNMRPFETEFSFALGCSGDVCNSHLSYDVKFLDLENNTYIIGSADVIRMEVLISNSGESAYWTQLTITLPKHVRLYNIPKKCEDVEHTLVCLVGNPLELDKQVYLPIYFNMKDVQTNHKPSLTFSANISTSSNNKNPVVNKNYTLHLKKVVDLQLEGKAEPALLFYTTNATFKQIYQIQKKGFTPAEEVTITIKLPTHIQKNNVSFPIVKLYSIEGSMLGRDIFCKNHSQVDYIRKTDETISELDVDSNDIGAMIREKRSIDSDIVYTNNLNNSADTQESETNDNFIGDFLNDKTLRLDCDDELSNVICTRFTCDIGNIKRESDIAIVRIHALLDVNELKKKFQFENSIVLNSYGHVKAAFDTDTLSNNNVNITSTFLDSKDVRIDMWVLLGATLTGLLLLIIVTIILYKYGFFTRSKKLQLEEEKQIAATEEFGNARLSGEPPNQQNDSDQPNDCDQQNDNDEQNRIMKE